MIVIDASALTELLIASPIAAGVRERISSTGGRLHAPHLIDIEVMQALRRFDIRGDVPGDRTREAVEALAMIPLVRHGHSSFLSRIWRLRPNFTAYDSVYVALAESLCAPLLTLDQRLAAAVQAHTKVGLV